MTRYLATIWRCRYFWLSLVKMDLRTRYRRSVLGMGWSLLHPIAMTAVICLIFRPALKAWFQSETGDGAELDLTYFAPFVLAGFACWNYVVSVTLAGCKCLFQGESYIRQYPAPVAVYPLRTALGAGIHFLLPLAAVLVLSWSLSGFGNLPALLSLIPTLILLFFLGWSLAIIAGFANVYFHDTQHLCEVAFQILFYATPVMYPIRIVPAVMAPVLSCNPLVAFLDLIRKPILDGQAPASSTFAIAGLTVLIAVSTAGFLLARLERRFIFHL